MIEHWSANLKGRGLNFAVGTFEQIDILEKLAYLGAKKHVLYNLAHFRTHVLYK